MFRGDSASTIVQRCGALGHAAGDAIESAGNLASDPVKALTARARELASKVGDEAKFVIDVATLQHDMLNELGKP